MRIAQLSAILGSDLCTRSASDCRAASLSEDGGRLSNHFPAASGSARAPEKRGTFRFSLQFLQSAAAD